MRIRNGRLLTRALASSLLIAALAAAAPGHVEAVRALVVDALSRDQLHQLTTIGGTILDRLEAEARRR